MHARRKHTCIFKILFSIQRAPLSWSCRCASTYSSDHVFLMFVFYSDADGTLHVLAPISLAAGKYNVRSTCFGDWGNSVRLHPYDSHFQFRKVCTPTSLNSIFSIRNKGTHRVIQRTLYQPQGLLQGQICPVYTPFTCGVHTQKLYKHYRAGS